MDLSQETKDKIGQLQLFEQNLHSYLQQKQQIQSQILEIENALKELEKSSGPAYKIVGQVMLASKPEQLTKDLTERKDVIALRLKHIDRQEKAVKEKAEKIQKEVMQEIEKVQGSDGGTD